MKQLSLIVSLAILALALAACGGGAAEPTPLPEPTVAPTLVTIDLPPTAVPLSEADATATAESIGQLPEPPSAPSDGSIQVLTVGVNASFEPFLFKDEAGNLAGIDIDLLNALGALANVEVAYIDTPFAEVLDGVADGEYDAGMAAITVTPERAERMLFTEPYFSTGQMPVSFLSAGQGLAVSITSTLTGADELTAASRIGVKSATTGAEYAAANLTGEITDYPESDVLLAALVAGEVDAAVLDNAVVAEYILANPNTIRLAGGPLVEEAYAIAVRPGGERIVATLNGALDELKANGGYQAILDKWLAP